MIVKIELEWYPTSTAAEFWVDLFYRECYPSNFQGSNIKLDDVTVGDPAFKVNANLNQAPCIFRQEYYVEVINAQSGRAIVLP